MIQLMSSSPSSVIGPDTLVRFGDSGAPTGLWRMFAEQEAREGSAHAASTYHWLADEFDRRVSVVREPVDAADPDNEFQRLLCRIGEHRLFEFAVALEEVRFTRKMIRDDLACDLGHEEKIRIRCESHASIAKEALHSNIDNIMCRTRYADNLSGSTIYSRWIDTVPPAGSRDDLEEFAQAYVAELRAIEEFPPSDVLHFFGLHRRSVTSCDDASLPAAAGRWHAWQTIASDHAIRDQLSEES